MKDFSHLIEETENRYRENEAKREENKEKIKTGNIIDADNKEIIAKRLDRLARNNPFSMRESLGMDISRPEPAALERILNKNDLISISYLEQGLQVAKSVGRIRIRNKFGQILGHGTGFMVSPRLLLTNNHVLENEAEAKFSQVEFNFQKNWSGNDLPSAIFELQPEVFFLTDKNLDFSLVAVKETSTEGTGDFTDLSKIGWSLLIEEENKVIIGESLNIIQHPNGEPKQVALRENKLVDRLETFLHYETDTAPGSSGSPVLNDQWEVVALHHSGVPKRDENGKILAKDGKVWTEAMGEHRVDWKANEGVRISRILKHLKSQNLNMVQKQLLQQLFEASLPNLPQPTSKFSTTNLINNIPNTGEQKMENNSIKPEKVLLTDSQATEVTWTIPLQVTVQLGMPIQSVNVGKPLIVDKSNEIPAEKDLSEALGNLNTALSGNYYDADADRVQIRKYYENIDTSVSQEIFYTNLNQLVTQTHRNKLPYKPAVHLYPEVDLQPDGMLRSVYSEQTFNPEELIREDFRIDQKRAEVFREKSMLETNWGAEKMTAELDLLEANLPYNCEHVVPQSWFGKRQPMKGDLHHLFTCEMRCNSFRNNTPYFDFADFNEVIRTDCGKTEGNKFEPFGGKGAIARATLYFLIRYPKEINDISNEFEANRIDILLDWHQENPVTDYERHRNAVIFKKQGNRNPFIDFPEWSGQVDFESGLG